MSSGYNSVKNYLLNNTEKDLGKTLNKCADAFNEAAPSSLGTITSFFLKGMAKELKGLEYADQKQIAVAMRAGITNVTAKVGSTPGQKTILDSIDPAITVLEHDFSSEAYINAAKAAKNGSERTKEMKAVWGRAAYYGENSIGIIDGGSVVGALVFEALSEK